MRLVSGFQDTRSNGEDFALTPYVFGVWTSHENGKVRGFGLCWGYYSVYIGVGSNIPKGFPWFHVVTKTQ